MAKKENSRVKCLKCNVILESTHRHDCKVCGCENGTMVDGGSDYLRMGGKNMSLVGLWSAEDKGWVSVTELHAREQKKKKEKK